MVCFSFERVHGKQATARHSTSKKSSRRARAWTTITAIEKNDRPTSPSLNWGQVVLGKGGPSSVSGATLAPAPPSSHPTRGKMVYRFFDCCNRLPDVFRRVSDVSCHENLPKTLEFGSMGPFPKPKSMGFSDRKAMGYGLQEGYGLWDQIPRIPSRETRKCMG